MFGLRPPEEVLNQYPLRACNGKIQATKEIRRTGVAVASRLYELPINDTVGLGGARLGLVATYLYLYRIYLKFGDSSTGNAYV
jgi:hypothetical protein